jgi:hypothetical protein
MVLVDTSIWVDHFRHAEPRLQELLNLGQAATHPFVIGELACGNLRNRAPILDLLRALPSAKVATDDEVLELLDANALYGKGLGWIDAHLLASALLSHVPLWTKDRRLAAIAKTLGVAEKR